MYDDPPGEIYVSKTGRGGYSYHTHTECPNLPPVTRTLTPGDSEYGRIVDERDECQWCRYDTLDVLELEDEEG